MITALLSLRETCTYGFWPAKPVFNAGEGLDAIGFSGIAQWLKANMCFCAFPNQGLSPV